MLSVFADHLDTLDRYADAAVIPWASPVPYFGGAPTATVATVGINPSNLEFADEEGAELDGHRRRLPTLRSLELARWEEANSVHLRELVAGCDGYFRGRPYDRWFGVLERVLRPAGFTYYGEIPTACHLDLVAFATLEKWSALPARGRARLLDSSREAFGLLVRSTPATLLLLNGRSVVDAFGRLANSVLEPMHAPAWDLLRPNGSVPGTAYLGTITELGGVPLDREVTVAGWNHNLQSSFGVTSVAVAAIGEWVASIGRGLQ